MTMWLIGAEELVTDAYAYSIAATNHMRWLDRLESLYVDLREMRSALHTTIFRITAT